MRILIAEDDSVTRCILEKLLTGWGHEVVSACDGHQAWEVLSQPGAPQMVILDWMMPGVDGVEICRRLRDANPAIRPYLILLTVNQQKKDLVYGITAGADDYVTKPFEPEELRVRIVAGQRILDLQAEALAVMEVLRKQATHDYLTGLLNRESILGMLDREFSRAPRAGRPVSVLMADVDRFKQINDTCGHTIGDAILRETARRIALTVRSYEFVGRYGGDEFLVVLAECDLRGAAAVAKRLLRAVEAAPFETEKGPISLALSIGAACTDLLNHPTPELLIELADGAMYRAKRGGRSRVELAGEQTACESVAL